MKTYALNMPSKNVFTSTLKERMEEDMGFSLTREREMIKKLVQQFAENELDQAVADGDLENVFLEENVGKMAALGFAGISILLSRLEKDIILEALMENDCVVSKAAKTLGIHRTTLYKKMGRLNIKFSRLVDI